MKPENSTSDNMYLKKAEEFFILKKYDEAESFVNSVLRVNPDCQRAKDLLSRLERERLR